MKTIIVYESYHHGNTRKVAEAMGLELDARLARPAEVDPAMLGDYGLIGFGSGIYNGHLHPQVLDLIGRLPRMEKRAFLFYTCGLDRGEPYTRDARKKLLEKGLAIAGTFSCPGWDTIPPIGWFGGINRNRPDGRDLEKARAFARSLAS